MGIVKTLVGNFPPPRTDGEPFTSARVDESAAETGPFTPLETFALSPVDLDPLHPAARSFTVTSATLDDGWLRVTWIDAEGNFSFNDPVFAKAEPTTLASVADVKRVLQLAPGQVVSDDDLAHALNVVVSFLQNKLQDFSATSGTEVIYGARVGDVIYMPVQGASVAAVRAFYESGAAVALVGGVDYELDVDKLRLRSPGYVWDPRYGPDVDSSVRWHKIEIDWSNTATVPLALREGIAMAAARLYTLNPTLVKGTRSERIGSYSYTLSDKDVESTLSPIIKDMLKPFMKRRRVFVT